MIIYCMPSGYSVTLTIHQLYANMGEYSTCHNKLESRFKRNVQKRTPQTESTFTETTMQCIAFVQTQNMYCPIYGIRNTVSSISTVSTLIVRNAICISVCIWIMLKHLITTPRRLGIHPVLVFKLILQMPSAWHFCEEAGTPSGYRWNPPHGAEQKIIFHQLYPLFPVPYL